MAKGTKYEGPRSHSFLLGKGTEEPAAREPRTGGRGHGAAPEGARRGGVAAPAQTAYYGGRLRPAARGLGRAPSCSPRQVSSRERRQDGESAGSLLAASLTLKPGPHRPEALVPTWPQCPLSSNGGWRRSLVMWVSVRGPSSPLGSGLRREDEAEL